MRVTCLQHTADVVPANVAAWATARGHDLAVVRVDQGAPFPEPDTADLVVVLGGPMAAWEEDEHPWLREEKAWLRGVLERRVPTLGICLGSQLLAEVLGGSVHRHAQREIGWWPVEMLDAAAGSPVFSALPTSFDTFQWHSDTWTLPPDATLVASSECCTNQAFEWGGFVYGVQFHPEFSHADTTTMAQRKREPVEGPFVQQAAAFLSEPERFEALCDVLFPFLDAIARRHQSAVPANEPVLR